MSHLYSFLAQIRDSRENLWEISQEENLHLTRVLRLQQGDEVQVFDGKGNYSQGALETVSKSHSLVRGRLPLQQLQPGPPLSVAVSYLKPSVLDEVLPFLVELGVAHIHFYHTQGHSFNLNQQRHAKVIIAAAKQCKNFIPPQIHLWPSLQQCLQQVDYHTLIYLEHGKPKTTHLDGMTNQPTLLVCGSEQGYSLNEQEILLQQKAQGLTLHGHVLRAKTAIILGASLLLQVSEL